MSVSKERARELEERRQPVFGWVELGDGLYSAPNDFAHNNVFLSEGFENYTERMQARWSLYKYVRVVVAQWRERRQSNKPKS